MAVPLHSYRRRGLIGKYNITWHTIIWHSQIRARVYIVSAGTRACHTGIRTWDQLHIPDEGACIDRNTWDLRGPGPHRASPEVVVVAVVVVVMILTKW